MKCIHCGSWTDVLDTREKEGGTVMRRRHRCSNGCPIFVTMQVYATVFNSAKPRQAAHTKTLETRWALAKRNREIRKRVRNGEQLTDVAKDYGITKSSVWLIMKGAK